MKSVGNQFKKILMSIFLVLISVLIILIIYIGTIDIPRI